MKPKNKREPANNIEAKPATHQVEEIKAPAIGSPNFMVEEYIELIAMLHNQKNNGESFSNATCIVTST